LNEIHQPVSTSTIPDRGAISEVQAGASAPLGASVTADGVNFSVFFEARDWDRSAPVEHVDDEKPASVIHVHPASNRTYHYWHVFVPALKAGQIYGYRVYGPFEPSKGFRFDATKVLLDPYGRAVVVPARYNRAAAHEKGDNAATAMKSVVVDPSLYDWESDRPLHRSSSQTIVYEMHVRGFTKDPSSGLPEATRGTYSGVIEKIPYLQELGVTAVELMPVFQFDALDCPTGHVNYWGTHRSRSSRRTRRTVRGRTRSVQSTSSATW